MKLRNGHSLSKPRVGHYKINKIRSRPYFGVSSSDYKDQRIAKRGPRYSPIYYRNTNRPSGLMSAYDKKHYPNAKFVAPWFG